MIDVVLTVLIIGVLAAAAAPRYANSLHQMRVQAAAERIKADLGYVRQSAISESGALTVSFVPATESYSVAGLAHINHPGQTFAVDLTLSPYNAQLVSAALGGDADIQFDRFGKPDSGGTITVASGGFQQTVTIDADSGKASIP